MLIKFNLIADYYNICIENKLRSIQKTITDYTNQMVFKTKILDKHDLKVIIIRLKKVQKELKESKLTYTQYYFIIQKFLYYNYRRMFDEGYTFRIYNIGSMKIIKKRPKISIDENGEINGRRDITATYKLKQELIAEGKELYHPTECPHGEKYFIYIMREMPQFYFAKSPFIKDYKLKFFSRNDALGTLLHREIAENPELLSRFKSFD